MASPPLPDTDRRASNVIRVLDADPDLGSTLPPTRFAEARSRLVARVHAARPGPWSDARLRRAGPGLLGLLIVDGVISRELLMVDNVSAELLGQGDVIRPWQDHSPSRLLQSEVRWTILRPTRFAVLGPGFATALVQFPEVNTIVISRVIERAHRLALTQSISQLNGVDRRVLALFWHLAERWGRVTPDGVVVPLTLPHRIIAQLVGARRPTVSTAIARLVAEGTLDRRHDGTWLLQGEPVGLPTEATTRIVRVRRGHVPA